MRVPQAAARFDYRYSHDDHQALDVFGAWQRSIGTREFDPASREYNLLSSLLRRALPRPAVLGGPARPGLPPWEAEDLGDYDLLNPSSAARRKQVLLEEGWPRGELPSKGGVASTCRLALRCGRRWAWPTMAMPLRPVSTCTTRATRRRWTSDKWSTR